MSPYREPAPPMRKRETLGVRLARGLGYMVCVAKGSHQWKRPIFDSDCICICERCGEACRHRDRDA